MPFAANLTLIRILTLPRIVTNPWQSALAVIAIAIGVAVLFAVLVLQTSLTASFGALTRMVKGDATLEVVHAAGVGFAEDVRSRLLGVAGVKAVAPLLELPALATVDERAIRVTVIGVDPVLARTLRAERAWVDSIGAIGPLSAIVTPDVLGSRGGEGSRIVRVQAGDREVRLRIGGTLGNAAGQAPYGGQLVLVPMEIAQSLSHNERQVTSLLVVPQPERAGEKATKALARDLNQALGPELLALPVDQRLANLREATGTVQSFAAFSSIIALAVGGCLILNSMAMFMRRERRQIGVLLAIGESRRRVAVRAIAFAAALGGVGGALGLLAGYFLGNELVASVPRLLQSMYTQDLRTVVDLPSALLAGIMGPIACVAGALHPTLAVIRLQPVQAMAPAPSGAIAAGTFRLPMHLGFAGCVALLFVIAASQMSGRFGPHLLVVGTVGTLCAMPALLQIGLHRAGSTLAQWTIRPCADISHVIASSLRGNPARCLATMFAAALSISAVVAIGGTRLDVERSVTPYADGLAEVDIYVTTKDDPFLSVGLSPRTVRDVAAVDGVERVDELTTAFVWLNDHKIWLQGVDPDAAKGWYFVLHGVDRESVSRVLRAGAVLVSTQIAHREGLRAGDSITIDTARGPTSLQVAATFESWSWPAGTVVMNGGLLRQLFDHQSPSQLAVTVKAGMPTEAVRERIASLAGIDATSGPDLRDRALNEIRDELAPFKLVQFAVVVMLVIMVLNTSLLSILQRQREIGILRAIGMSRRQLEVSIVLEESLLLLISAIVGVAIGMLLQNLGVESIRDATGLALRSTWHRQPALEGLAAAIVGAIAGGSYPARRAAMLEIVEAITYE